MLRLSRQLRRCKLVCREGPCGRVLDFYFDDARWVLRYALLDTGWIPGHRVLVPASLLEAAGADVLRVDRTQEEILTLPDAASDMPISRRHVLRVLAELGERAAPAAEGDPHLQSVREVVGYAVQATDGVVGQVGDLLVDEATWCVRALVVELLPRTLRREATVAPEVIDHISWLGVDVSLRIPEAAIASRA